MWLFFSLCVVLCRFCCVSFKKMLLSVCLVVVCEKEERKEFALTEKTILAGKKKEKGGNT